MNQHNAILISKHTTAREERITFSSPDLTERSLVCVRQKGSRQWRLLGRDGLGGNVVCRNGDKETFSKSQLAEMSSRWVVFGYDYL